MWSATPKGWMSWDYAIRDEAGRLVGDVSLAFWRERGTIGCADGEFQVRRQSGFGAFVLEQAGVVVARAEKPGPFGRTVFVEYGGGPYALKPRGILRREMVLYNAEREIGSIGAAAFLTRRSRVLLPDELPVALRLFLIWLAVLDWRRGAASSS
jgi:hypothetical protein